MKKVILATVVALLSLSSLAEARGSFGSRSSFSSARSYSRPSYTAPRPIVRNTTVINQTHVTQSSGNSGVGGLGFMGTMLGSGVGSYLGNKLAQPSPQATAASPQYPLCPAVIPVGWNTPCIPQPPITAK